MASATVSWTEDCFSKLPLVAFGTWRLARKRKPHIVFREIVGATADVGIGLAQVVVGAAGRKNTFRRNRDCAHDFAPCCESVQPERASNVNGLHERCSRPGCGIRNETQTIQARR